MTCFSVNISILFSMARLRHFSFQIRQHGQCRIAHSLALWRHVYQLSLNSGYSSERWVFSSSTLPITVGDVSYPLQKRLIAVQMVELFWWYLLTGLETYVLYQQRLDNPHLPTFTSINPLPTLLINYPWCLYFFLWYVIIFIDKTIILTTLIIPNIIPQMRNSIAYISMKKFESSKILCSLRLHTFHISSVFYICTFHFPYPYVHHIAIYILSIISIK